jgi:hypothetical protein
MKRTLKAFAAIQRGRGLLVRSVRRSPEDVYEWLRGTTIPFGGCVVVEVDIKAPSSAFKMLENAT